MAWLVEGSDHELNLEASLLAGTQEGIVLPAPWRRPEIERTKWSRSCNVRLAVTASVVMVSELRHGLLRDRGGDARGSGLRDNWSLVAFAATSLATASRKRGAESEGEEFEMSAAPAKQKRLEVEFGEVHEKNVGQLKLINSIVFPVKYNDQFYRGLLRTYNVADAAELIRLGTLH